MPRFALVALALLVAAPLAAAPVEVRHQPLRCVAPGTHAVVTASAAQVEDVATAELQFRKGDEGDWYGVPMFLDGESWSARLPQPHRKLKSFYYRVTMTSANLDPSSTAPFEVKVQRGCTTTAEATLASPIVVRAPQGASPLPGGFEPIGLVAAQRPADAPELQAKTSRGAKVTAGAAILAGVAGVAALATAESKATDDDTLPPGFGVVVNPGFAFSHTLPASGSDVRVGSTLSVFVNMLAEPPSPIDLEWRLDLVGSDLISCAYVEGVFNDARRPLGLIFVGPLVANPGCPSRAFDAVSGRLRISSVGSPFRGGQEFMNTTVPMSFHVEP